MVDEGCRVRSFAGLGPDWYVEICAAECELVLAAWDGIEMAPTAFVAGSKDCVSLTLIVK